MSSTKIGTELEEILRVEAISKSFGDFHALDNVDLKVNRGALHAVIGPNGAGKTTFFNVLTGQLGPSSGRILFKGQSVEKLPAYKRAHLGMARSFQITSSYPDLPVRENVRLAAQAVSRSTRRNVLLPVSHFRGPLDIARDVLSRAGLSRWAEVKAGNLSHGLSRRLEIAMALASGPEVLLLDEPLSGMGVDDIPGMEVFLRSLVPEHTVVLVEHNMPVTLAIADRVTVLVGGRILTEGLPREVAEDERVREAYLGRGHV